MRRNVAVVLCAASFLLTGATQRAFAQPAEGDGAEAPEISPAERAFADTMDGATMVGNFTVTGDESPNLRPERYDLGEVRKLTGELWLIQTRIRYGDKDVTLPITLPVRFAGDTAVIVVDKVGFPGLGTYSARVLVHDGKYAGYWQGTGHGGHLFGTIERAKAAPADAEDQGSEVRSDSGGEG